MLHTRVGTTKNHMIPDFAEVRSMTVLAHWSGFAVPSRRLNRLDIRKLTGNDFESTDAMNQTVSRVAAGRIQSLLNAMRESCERPDPSHFGRSQEAIDFQFNGCHTDDYPQLRVNVVFENHSRVELRTVSNHAHLLPWTIVDDGERTSFNPQISVRLAELLPQGFLFRDRLADSTAEFRADELMHEAMDRLALERNQESVAEGNRDTSTALHELECILSDVTEDGENVPDRNPRRNFSAKQLRRLDEQELIELASNGYDLSTSDEIGQTALMLAAYPPFNREQFRKLVRVGANVDARRADGLTGLMLACAGQMAETAKEWLLAGADVHHKGPNGVTSLMLGAKNGNIVEDLVNRGASVGDVDDDGDTALDYAIDNPSVMWAGRCLKSIEILSRRLAVANPNLLERSRVRAMEVARRCKLEKEILHAFGDHMMSEKIAAAKSRQETTAACKSYLKDVYEFIDLEITEVELADRIVQILNENTAN